MPPKLICPRGLCRDVIVCRVAALMCDFPVETATDESLKKPALEYDGLVST
jgi:hypothetical protein